jgi:hypothetical protein
MKKIFITLLFGLVMISCNRDMEFDTISVTDPALEVLVVGSMVNNVYPKIEGATVQLYNSSNTLLATSTTDSSGSVVFKKDQLKEKGVFTVKVAKGTLSAEGQTAYMLLNDGVTLLTITLN